VTGGVTSDVAGNPNTAATFSYTYQPANPSYTTVSTVANSVAGGTLGLALVVPLAVGVLTTGTNNQFQTGILAYLKFQLHVINAYNCWII
jgi:hypothetical protein